MDIRKNVSTLRARGTWRQRLSAVAVGLLAALLAAPGAAVTVPDLPLQTGTAYPPANIMFILDDSGSMNFVAMPRDVKDFGDLTNYGAIQAGLNDNPTDRSYLNNSLYYDPRNTYLAWMTDAGTRMTGGRDVTAVFTSWDQAGTGLGTRDLRDSAEGFFYVPKAGVTSSTNANDFDKYFVTTLAGTTVVARTLRRAIHDETGIDVARNGSRDFSINVPTGTTRLEVVTSGGTGDARLVVFNPLGVESCNVNNDGGNNERCELNTTILPGNRTVTIRATGG